MILVFYLLVIALSLEKDENLLRVTPTNDFILKASRLQSQSDSSRLFFFKEAIITVSFLCTAPVLLDTPRRQNCEFIR